MKRIDAYKKLTPLNECSDAEDKLLSCPLICHPGALYCHDDDISFFHDQNCNMNYLAMKQLPGSRESGTYSKSQLKQNISPPPNETTFEMLPRSKNTRKSVDKQCPELPVVVSKETDYCDVSINQDPCCSNLNLFSKPAKSKIKCLNEPKTLFIPGTDMTTLDEHTEVTGPLTIDSQDDAKHLLLQNTAKMSPNSKRKNKLSCKDNKNNKSKLFEGKKLTEGGEEDRGEPLVVHVPWNITSNGIKSNNHNHLHHHNYQQHIEKCYEPRQIYPIHIARPDGEELQYYSHQQVKTCSSRQSSKESISSTLTAVTVNNKPNLKTNKQSYVKTNYVVPCKNSKKNFYNLSSSYEEECMRTFIQPPPNRCVKFGYPRHAGKKTADQSADMKRLVSEDDTSSSTSTSSSKSSSNNSSSCRSVHSSTNLNLPHSSVKGLNRHIKNFSKRFGADVVVSKAGELPKLKDVKDPDISKKQQILNTKSRTQTAVGASSLFNRSTFSSIFSFNPPPRLLQSNHGENCGGGGGSSSVSPAPLKSNKSAVANATKSTSSNWMMNRASQQHHQACNIKIIPCGIDH